MLYPKTTMSPEPTELTSPTAVAGPWTPLRQPTFRYFWLAILLSNMGTWMHDVAAAWVMAETTGSAFMVAAVQSASTLPMVVLAIAAGALADVVDRRRYLLLAQLWMLLSASGLALLQSTSRPCADSTSSSDDGSGASSVIRRDPSGGPITIAQPVPRPWRIAASLPRHGGPD